ncbi:MAG TPA: thiamine pyrophosphate-binding protein [Thermoanaerobaculia bacterium]|nr:thiamine pyrophosphate-binding protein [Thermoanaerobaculia bacterium]
MNGGELIARVLQGHGVPFLFTLCGGHISPILVECKRLGIRVVDTRHEATAVFAADAVGRLSGTPGVAAVTAGPGVTNAVTALKNAQMAQSPVVLLGGATATVLEGRGALQDIDQLALVKSLVKWSGKARRVRELPEKLSEALWAAQEGVPGPVFLECPVDLLYDPAVVRGWYEAKSRPGRKASLGDRALAGYLRWHARRLFRGAGKGELPQVRRPEPPLPDTYDVRRAAVRLARAERPLLLIGSQALLEPQQAGELAHAVEQLGVPVYLAGMARGILGPRHPLQLRHQRRKALKEADLVLLAGVPADFRLDYGRQIGRQAWVMAANRSADELFQNRRPDLGVHADPGRFLRLLAQTVTLPEERWRSWFEILRERDEEREEHIARTAEQPTAGLNPLALLREVEAVLPDDCILVADGGDFVATASYILRPRAPLSWLDPGAFGTLGVGAGFALGAKLCRPDAEVWIVYGDGSLGYSLAELDTFVRHGVPVIALVGNDACWMQIAREQVEILDDDVGCILRHTDYHAAAEGFGGKGLLVRAPEQIQPALRHARQAAAQGHPVLINAHIGATDFRQGSISM